MVSALDSRRRGQGLKPGRFFGRSLLLRCLPGVQMGAGKLSGKLDYTLGDNLAIY